MLDNGLPEAFTAPGNICDRLVATVFLCTMFGKYMGAWMPFFQGNAILEQVVLCKMHSFLYRIYIYIT